MGAGKVKVSRTPTKGAGLSLSWKRHNGIGQSYRALSPTCHQLKSRNRLF
uniref:Uncharacterized protein n=2 Tax=unclassified Caudoviricetes TaxID=2788787 RepID=A0A8S5NNG3_9CAUD|nr:MAG TPA: hypothetical protein [Myoviridae sp. ctzRR1]DAD96249.1 MAG TPA: hypothetical protein [Myoviridae sp. ct0mM28]